MCCNSRYPCPHNESLTRRSPRLNAAFSRGAVYIVLFFWVAETSLSRCAAAIDKNGAHRCSLLVSTLMLAASAI